MGIIKLKKITAVALAVNILTVNISDDNLLIYAENEIMEKSRFTALDTEYGYQKLSERSNGAQRQMLYQVLEDNAATFEENTNTLISGEIQRIDLTEFGLTEDEVYETFNTFMMDNPQYYWVDSEIKIVSEHEKQYLYLCVDEAYWTADIREQNKEMIRQKLAEYTALIAEGADCYAIALEVHNKMIGDIDYKYEEDGVTPSEATDAHNIIGVFSEDGAVCEGYAKAYQLVLNYMGVENVYAIGYAGGNTGNTDEMVLHAWNYVKMEDGNYYAVDVTWDDIGTEFDENYGSYEWYQSPYNSSRIRYDYFMRGNTFHEDHWYMLPETVGLYYLYEIPQVPEHDYVPENVAGLPIGSIFAMDEYMIRFKVLKNTNGKKEVEAYERTDGCNIGGTLIIPSTVTYQGVTYDVVGVDANVIANARDYTKLVVNEGIKYIEDGAFSGFMYTGETENTLYITEIELPSTLEYIGGFFGQPKLEKIVLPETNPYYKMVDDVIYTADMKTAVMHVPCSKITELILPDTLEKINLGAFAQSQYLEKIEFPEGLEYIYNEAFFACEKLSEVVIPANVKKVSQCAFAYCSELHSAQVLGNTNVHSIAFESCASLEKVEISDENQYCCDVDGVLYSADKSELYIYPAGKKDKQYVVIDECNRLSEFSFRGTKYLETVEIGENVRELLLAFHNSGVQTVIVSEDNANYASEKGMIFNKDKTRLIQYLAGCRDEAVSIPETVTSIAADAFQQNTYMKQLTMTDSVKSMGGLCFSGCINLESVRLSDNLQWSTEDTFLFLGCRNLKHINIPAATRNIPYGTFEECHSLSTIVIPQNVQSLYRSIFLNCYSLRYIIFESANTAIPDRSVFYTNAANIYLVADEQSDASSMEIPESTQIRWIDKKNVVEMDNVLYYVDGDEASLLCSLNKGSGDVVVKEEIDGMKVTEISDYAFINDFTLTSIVLPESIKTVGENAFMGCTGLNRIEVQNNDCKISNSNVGYSTYYQKISEKTYIASLIKSEDIVIVANRGSKALDHAKKLGMSYEVLNASEVISSDANSDGEVSSKDAVLMKKYLAGYENIEIDLEAADVTADGEVTSKDAVRLLRYFAGYDVVLGES